MRVWAKERLLVVCVDTFRFVHLVVVLDHLEELLVDQVCLLFLLFLLLSDQFVELVNINVGKGGLQAIPPQTQGIIHLKVVREAIGVFLDQIHGFVLIEERRVLALLICYLHLCC